MRKLFLTLTGLMLLLLEAEACLWEKGTLEIERRQFPAAVELITGKLAYLSKEFYEWRVEVEKEHTEFQQKLGSLLQGKHAKLDSNARELVPLVRLY
jgi:hypothetical protein